MTDAIPGAINAATSDPWLAGVDGCRTGWIAAFVRPAGAEVRVRVVPRFADVLGSAEAPAIAAVDIPIGLPDRIGPDGRGPEQKIRPLLGARQSSVFSVPPRAAIFAADFAAACVASLAASDPPRKVSKQLYMIAPKIREVDAVLRADPALAARVYEVHPELAFWRLNGEHALAEAKPPAGAGADDLLDALACAAVARGLHAGTAQPFPDPPGRDAFGLPVA